MLEQLSIGNSASRVESEPELSLKGGVSASVAGIPHQGGGGASNSDAAARKGKNGFKPTKIFQSSGAGFQSNEDRAADLAVVKIFNDFKAELEKWYAVGIRLIKTTMLPQVCAIISQNFPPEQQVVWCP